MNIKLMNMCMILYEGKAVVQVRTKNDWPGVTFPGGKVEKNESIYDATIREVREETGLEVVNLKHCGIVHYKLLEKEERWIIHLYKTSDFKGKLMPSDHEDAVYWLALEDFPKVSLAYDLEIFMKLFLDDTIQEAHGYYSLQTKTSCNLKVY